MCHLDATAAAALYVKEASSTAVQRWFRAQPSGDTALGGWTVTEFTSALGIRVRAGSVAPPTARGVVAAFGNLARLSLTMILVQAADLDRAGDLMLRFDLGLRAGDALHLAVAQNAGAASLVTLDQQLASAAVQLGMTVGAPA